MSYTLTCPRCATRLSLFTGAIQKRKGTIRCTRCGSRIAYDLDARRIQKTGYPKETLAPFDSKAKEKMLSGMSKEKQKDQNKKILRENPFQKAPGFAPFNDRVASLPGKRTPSPVPSQKKEEKP